MLRFRSEVNLDNDVSSVLVSGWMEGGGFGRNRRIMGVVVVDIKVRG